ncbi:DNA (cytosine-5-)-methyltransferase, partial [Acinetobacter baumannii]|nr:DNA (cytosine-5-)-methyltransferase [Acinetobacter baumannii]
QLKGKCVFSSEWDKFAQKTYAANFGELPSGDITQIRAADIPDHDILLGGFPCQAFSQAGKRQGFQDTRGTMFFEIQRILVE